MKSADTRTLSATWRNGRHVSLLDSTSRHYTGTNLLGEADGRGRLLVLLRLLLRRQAHPVLVPRDLGGPQ